MSYLSKDAILQADDLQVEDVEVPEWSGVVRVSALSGTERDKIEALVSGNGKKMNLDNFRARMCAACLVDEGGERMFAESEIAALGAKSARGLERVFEVALRMNGMSGDDVESLTGESEPGRNGSSTSDWPGTSA